MERVPSTCTDPESGVMRPAATDSNVDLPDPDSPTMAVRVLDSAMREASASAVVVVSPSW